MSEEVWEEGVGACGDTSDIIGALESNNALLALLPYSHLALDRVERLGGDKGGNTSDQRRHNVQTKTIIHHAICLQDVLSVVITRQLRPS
jgi:hypothetical protein